MKLTCRFRYKKGPVFVSILILVMAPGGLNGIVVDDDLDVHRIRIMGIDSHQLQDRARLITSCWMIVVSSVYDP